MKEYTIPDYYTDETLTEEEKQVLDWKMIGEDFAVILATSL